MCELRSHPHVISLKDFLQDAQYFYILEELAEGGELFDAILHPALLAGKECGTSGVICAPEGGNGRGAEEKERAASGGENRDSGKEKGERSA